tara:strand:+ start:2691 stop:4733 length:2043 start_codon:yes stop_codon:yes gene_type:complete
MTPNIIAHRKEFLAGLSGMGGGPTGLALGGAVPKRTHLDDVFSNYRYRGNDGTQEVDNGIDIAGDGGMLILKATSNSSSWNTMDTVQGANKYLKLNNNSAVATSPANDALKSFDDNGFTLGDNYNSENQNNVQFASWTFKKTKKFFDVVQYSGDTSSDKSIAHDLGSVPGMIWIKRTDDAASWVVWHKDLANSGYSNGAKGFLTLNESDNNSINANGFQTQPTSTHFSVNANYGAMNASGATYIAYLFADSEAVFGPKGNQPITKAGYFDLGTGGAASGTTNFIDLGFKPAVLIMKKISGNADWIWYDEKNRMPTWNDKFKLVINGEDQNAGGNHPFENMSNASTSLPGRGFKIINGWALAGGAGSGKYIYYAIAAETGVNSTPPEVANNIFTIDSGNGSTVVPIFDSNFPVDYALMRSKTQAMGWSSIGRTTEPNRLFTSSNSSSNTDLSDRVNFKWNKGHMGNFGSYNSNFISWMWKNSAGFESLAYKGIDQWGTYIEHSLGVEPEMTWIKTYNGGTYDWSVWHKGLNGGTSPYDWHIVLNSNAAEDGISNSVTATSSTQVTLGNSARVNENNKEFVMMLFASISGISKVGQYSGTGSNQSITTGFQPKFIIIKARDQAEHWVVVDQKRGFSQVMYINSSNIQFTSSIVSVSATGFNLIGSNGLVNGSTANYIYYAHA